MNLGMYTGTAELGIAAVLMLIAVLFILAGKSPEKPFFGTLILGGIVFIQYGNHCSYDAKAYVLKRFNEGAALECGLWRAESVLVDPNNGWRWEQKIGFVKHDQIRNDPKLCRVIGEDAPEPSSALYWLFYISTTVILLTLRSVTLQWRESFDKEVEGITREESLKEEKNTKDEA
jgi:hypothetical protein